MRSTNQCRDSVPTRPSRRFLGVVVVVLVGLAALLSACGGGGSSSSSSSTAAGAAGAEAVTIKDYKFAPPSVTVPVGTAIKFTNEDSTAHTATSKQSGAFETGSIEPGKSATIKLEEAGTYTYYCAFHPFMKGTITVE